jgi:hypothetical protein
MSVLKSVVQSVDSSPQVEEMVKENLNTLVDLAESKTEVFESEIKQDLKSGKATDDLTIPITKVLAKKLEYRAITQTSTSDFAKEVCGSLQKLFSGDEPILTGLGNIITEGLDTVLGAGEGEEAECRSYYVVAEYPAIVRFDLAFWNRTIKAKALQQHISKAVACVAYKSAVDVTKLQFNDFLSLYGPVLRKAYGGDQKKIDDMILKSEEIYRKFNVNVNAKDGKLKALKSPVVPNFQVYAKTMPAEKGDF